MYHAKRIQNPRWADPRLRAVIGVMALVVLGACGGGDTTETGSTDRSSLGGAPNLHKQSQATTAGRLALEVPATREEAARFLTRATFGPTETDIARLMSVGYSAWIDEQFEKPVSSHRAVWEALDDRSTTADDMGQPAQDRINHSFWRTAVTGEDQLRQRVALALSEIFVVSLADSNIAPHSRGVASYYDLLATTGLTSYRQLIEGVSKHPMMGRYLTMLANRKGDPKRGRVPDENYAREVMQLFSIGLWDLNLNGARRLFNGEPKETYTQADITGLAKVFTGWSWDCPHPPTSESNCFSNGRGTTADGQVVEDPDRAIKPMINYPQHHSTEAKHFLTVEVEKDTDGETSLRMALDRLATHDNTAPFISKQLIQRLVTSNPTPSYVSGVASVFRRTRGDMKAVVKAVLTHPEALQGDAPDELPRFGKVREPLLRLSAVMRAFSFGSVTGYYRIGNTDNPGTQLGQSVMRSPSVFNFYRPGYVPPKSSETARRRMVAPELQIAHETTVAGYANFMREAIAGGVGQIVTVNGVRRRDVFPNFQAELALAGDASALVLRVTDKLIPGGGSEALRTAITGAVEGIAVPDAGATRAEINAAHMARVRAAVFFTAISPEFLVQK